jgi:hypothetical protein
MTIIAKESNLGLSEKFHTTFVLHMSEQICFLVSFDTHHLICVEI